VLKRAGIDGVVKLIEDWFEDIKKIMFLTGSNKIVELQNNKILRKEKLY
jgi:isopentenyl diphosphate isomerase/L-lactate dehydrogenase-like FMN-dependent dehydrogenase